MAYTKLGFDENTSADPTTMDHLDQGIKDVDDDRAAHAAASNPHSGSASTSALNSHTGDDGAHVSVGGFSLSTAPNSFPQGVTTFQVDAEEGPNTNAGLAVTFNAGGNRQSQMLYEVFTGGPTGRGVWSRALSSGSGSGSWGDWRRLDNV